MIDELFAGDLWLLLLVQGTACLAIGLAASYVLRHRPARAHQILLTALLASVLMPGLHVSARYFGLGVLAPRTTPPVREIMETQPLEPALLAEMIATESAYEPMPSAEVESPAEASAHLVTTRPIPWVAIAAAGWLMITLVLLTRLALRFALGLCLLRAADPLGTEHVGSALAEARSRLGIDQPVRIRRSQKVRSPVIWCWVREPILLMQEAAADRREGTDWVGVFCHELAHWRRRDHLSGLFAELLAAVLPWHPLLWWAKDRLLKLSEQACDDWVLATGQSGVDYAEILLGLAAERQMAFLPTVFGKENTMNTRIRRIVNDKGGDPRIGTRWTMLVGALAVCTTLGVAVAQRRPAGPEPMDPPPVKKVKEHREMDMREEQTTALQRLAMKRLLEQLTRQAQEKKMMLGENRDLPEEERQVQQIELKLLVEQIEQMKHRFATLGRDPMMRPEPDLKERREPLRPEVEAKFDSLRQRHEELAQMAQKVERELEGLRDGQDREADELKLRLRKLHTEMAEVGKQMDSLKRSRLEERKLAPEEIERTKILRKPGAGQDREKLLQNLRMRAEKMAMVLKENPDMDAQKVEDLRRELEETRAKIGALEQDSRNREGKREVLSVTPKRDYRIDKDEFVVVKKLPPGPSPALKGPAGNPRLEAEVEDLRIQMKELHGQMQQMRELLEQAVERGRTDRPAN